MNDAGAPFGVPWPAWAGFALLAAALFGAGVGVPRPVPAGARGALVRWGHAAVWVLLAGMFATRSVGPSLEMLGNAFGLAGLGTYLAFLVAFVGVARARSRERGEPPTGG